jgi:hypothetical protein
MASRVHLKPTAAAGLVAEYKARVLWSNDVKINIINHISHSA